MPSFERHLRAENKSPATIKESPMAKMHPPKVPENPPEVLTDDELRKLFKACSGASLEERRDTGILAVLLDTGARRAEVAAMRLDDLDLDTGRVAVTGKGRRRRVLSIGKRTIRDLDRYLRLRAQHRDADKPDLWLGKHGPMTGSGIYQVAVDRAKQAGIKAYAHLFRHTFADRWLSDDGSEGDLMALAGWKSRTMLQRYAASRASERAIAAHKTRSARDRL